MTTEVFLDNDEIPYVVEWELIDSWEGDPSVPNGTNPIQEIEVKKITFDGDDVSDDLTDEHYERIDNHLWEHRYDQTEPEYEFDL